MKKIALVIALLAATLASECKKDNGSSSKYADNSMWLCKPDLENNYCNGNLSATEISPDGTWVPESFTPATQTDFDCFYIYPTVDISGPIGNHTDFSDVTPMLLPLMSQAARFSKVCTVFAPLYRQITLFTFGSADEEKYEEIAYSDVAEAFRYYKEKYNTGRPFVLIGHSQGSFMLRMLLQREFDGNPDLRSHLITALLIGGDVLVPTDQKVGETFTTIPVCTSEDEVGCVIAFQSFAKDYPPQSGRFTGGIPIGTDLACTNPANMSGSQVSPAAFEASYFPTSFNFGGLSGTFFTGMSTPFFLYKQFYAGRCVTDPTGSYLEISYPAFITDTTRQNVIPFDRVDPGMLLGINFGLHLLDYNFPMGNLITLVDKKAQAMKK